MHPNHFLSTHKSDIYKTIGVAIIAFLALTIRMHYITEPEAILQFDYLEENADIEHFANPEVENILAQILAILDEELPPSTVSEDSSPPISSQKTSIFDALCSSDKALCQKVSFNGTFSDKELYAYFKQFQFLVDEIDISAKRGDEVRIVLKNFILNQTKGSRRGSAGRDKLTINLGGIMYDNEYFQVLTHEMGHIVDLGSLQGKSKTKNANFTEFDKIVFAVDDPSLEYYKYSRQSETIRKSWVTRQDFCSGYGMSNPFEDFSECFNLYLNHQNIFRFLARTNEVLKNKYNYLANLYGGNFLSNSTMSLATINADWRAWDTTRIEE